MNNINDEILNAMTPAQINAYSKMYITDKEGKSPEMSLDEIFESMLEAFVNRQYKRCSEKFTPLNYFGLAEWQRKTCTDIARLLVTAKAIGEKIEITVTPEEMITDMIKELSAMARTVRDQISETGIAFGVDFCLYSEKVLMDLFGTIRRLKVTRMKYKDITPAKEPVRIPAVQKRPAISASKEQEPVPVQADRAFSRISAFLPSADPVRTGFDILGRAKTAKPEQTEKELPREKQRSEPSPLSRKEFDEYVAAILASRMNSS